VLLAAGVLAVSVGATGTSVASEPDDQQEGVVVPKSGSSSPGDVDQGPGPETTLPYEVDPVLTDPPDDGPEGDAGGGSSDETDEPGPIEVVPLQDPDADLQLTDPAVPGGSDSEALPVLPTPPAPPLGAPVTPDDPALEDLPRATSPAADVRVSWRPVDKKPRALRWRLAGNVRALAELPVGGSERSATQAPATISDPLAGEAPPGSTESVAAEVAPDSSEPVAGGAPAGSSEGAPLRGPFHVVRPGESLWSIASRLLGPDASEGSVAFEVRRLWRLNSQRIGTGDPNLLRVGVTLRLR
jgi:hypothetical protein